MNQTRARICLLLLSGVLLTACAGSPAPSAPTPATTTPSTALTTPTPTQATSSRSPTPAPVPSSSAASDLERAQTNVAKLIEYVNGILALPSKRLPSAADPYWDGIRAIDGEDILWVGSADLPDAARTAYQDALVGLWATDSLVKGTKKADKALAMLVGLQGDTVKLDAARIALK